MPATVRASAPLRMPAKIASGNLTRDLDLGHDELLSLLALARSVKANPPRYAKALSGRYLALLFEKPSLRTRITFELAIKQLGGDAVAIDGPIGAREPIKDVARNLERWTNGIVARTFSQQTIDALAEWAGVPVINALSDLYHPCQALADMLTLEEQFGDLRGRKLTFIGDGNNVAHSLMLCAARLGIDFAIGCPKGYEPKAEIVAEASGLAAATGAAIEITNDPFAAVARAHAVYTDVWTSMGRESENLQRLEDFAPLPGNGTRFGNARPDARVMHRLPAEARHDVSH